MLTVGVPAAPPPPTDPPGSEVNRRIDSPAPVPLPRLVPVMNSVPLFTRLSPKKLRVVLPAVVLPLRIVIRPDPLTVRVPNVSSPPPRISTVAAFRFRAGAVVVFRRVTKPRELSSRSVASDDSVNADAPDAVPVP